MNDECTLYDLEDVPPLHLYTLSYEDTSSSPAFARTPTLVPRSLVREGVLAVDVDNVHRIHRHIICIPKVSVKTANQYIFGVFCALKIGFIEKLTEVPIKTDPNYKRVFIKVKWNHSELAKYIIHRFDNKENVKIMYSEPWYWLCVSNTR